MYIDPFVAGVVSTILVELILIVGYAMYVCERKEEIRRTKTMARIPMTSGFTLIPEGTYVFRVYAATYDEEFGKIEVKLVNAAGMTHTERFSIKDNNDELNEKALNAFSYFAKTVMGDYTLEDIDPAELIDHFICAEVVHTKLPSNKDPNKMVTFANLGEKSPAEYFDTEPVARALTLGKNEAAPATAKPATAPAPAAPAAPAPAAKGLDLDALLGGL